MEINELSDTADKVMDLWEKMADTWPDSNKEAHLKLAIMAGLKDAWAKGCRSMQNRYPTPQK